MEVQFRDTVDSFFEDYTKEVIFLSDWISETIWVNESCFGGAFPQCKFESKIQFIHEVATACIMHAT